MSQSVENSKADSKAPKNKAEVPLYATKDNPIPSGAVVGNLRTHDGAVLRYTRWQAESSPSKGTVMLLHGRTEFIEKYFETVNDLRTRGFGVLTFDWRGQGGSSRLIRDVKKGHIENFDQYLADLGAMMNEIMLPDCKPPYYILGHSTGGLLALMGASTFANRVQRMVLVAPMLELNNLPMRQIVLQRIMGFMTFIGFGRSYVVKNRISNDKMPFESNKLTSDIKRYKRNREVLDQHPDLAVAGPTVAWLFAACRAMEQVNAPGYGNAISIPTLLVSAGNDQVVLPAAIEAYGEKMRSGSYLTIFGSKHEILHERDVYREQLLAAFDAFIPGGDV